MTDRLTVEQVEEIIADCATWPRQHKDFQLARQLADTMRENGQLRAALEDLLVRHGYTEKDGEWHWEALSNKDSDNA